MKDLEIPPEIKPTPQFCKNCGHALDFMDGFLIHRVGFYSREELPNKKCESMCTERKNGGLCRCEKPEV